MPDIREERDAFFSALKDMEQQAQSCAKKAIFLDNVLTAKEQVTFLVIDRCRDAVLQIRQSHYVVKAEHDRLAKTSLGRDNKDRLEELLRAATAANDQATQALDQIIAWVPAAVNTRALGSLAR